MPIDRERREVAAKLRELGKVVYNPDNTYELMADALGVDDFEGTDELFNRLADLIDPSEPEGTCGNCKHFIKNRFMPCAAAHGYTEADVSACEDFSPLSCDRAALLALADELDANAELIIRVARHAQFTGFVPTMEEAKHDAGEWRYTARRIREALGVES